MSHEKYTTEAFILKSYEQGESDLVYKIWTREFGIIFVLARSIRKVSAKLRMNAKKNQFLNTTLVKGKDIWRLTGVEESQNISTNDIYFLEIQKIIAEAVDKFIEEKKSYKKLFDKLKSIFIEEGIEKLEISKLKILIYYLVLVDTGYADARVIGVKDLEEYKDFSIRDFYTHFILNESEIKNHVVFVLKNSML